MEKKNFKHVSAQKYLNQILYLCKTNVLFKKLLEGETQNQRQKRKSRWPTALITVI